MPLIYEFELNAEERKLVQDIQADLFEKMLNGALHTDEGWNSHMTAYGNEMRDIYEKARERTLKYYSERPGSLYKALEAEVKNYVAIVRGIDESRVKVKSNPLDMDKWRKGFEKRIAPYMEILKGYDAEQCEKLTAFIQYAFEHREAFFEEARKRTGQEGMILTPSFFDAGNVFDFLKIWQGTGTNELIKITTSKKTPVNLLSDKVEIKKGEFEVALENFSKKSGVRTSTHKLLDIFMLKYAETGKKGISIPIQDFMELRGLKDRKSAEEQVKEDLDVLFSASLSFKQTEGKGKKKKTTAYMDARIIQDKGQALKRGIIQVTFGDKFFEAMQNYCIMPMPPAFLALNDKYTPNAYHLGRRIALHKNMNYGKDNADLISVETLLDACPNLADYEEVYKNGKQSYKQKIIEPFIRDMDAVESTNILSWEFCYSGGIPLNEAEREGLNYEIFKNLYVKITWKYYPPRAIQEKEATPTEKSKGTKSKNQTKKAEK